VEDSINSNTEKTSEKSSIYNLEDDPNPNELMEELEGPFFDPLGAQTSPKAQALGALPPDPPPAPDAPVTSAITGEPSSPSSPSDPTGVPSQNLTHSTPVLRPFPTPFSTPDSAPISTQFIHSLNLGNKAPLVLPATFSGTSGSIIVNSGATSCFIDFNFALSQNFPLRKKTHPEALLVVDGRKSSAGDILYKVDIRLQID